MTEYPVQTSPLSEVPDASEFTASPLRNCIRVELEAPSAAVWELVGDLSRLPEYSVGLERVAAKLDSGGACTEYVCHFKPQEKGGDGVLHLSLIRWYERDRGWASIDEEPNAFGLADSLTLVTLEQSDGSTVMAWSHYYDARDLDMIKAHLDEALADIAENLVARFGGRLTHRYVEE
jgi:hypothetical protein